MKKAFLLLVFSFVLAAPFSITLAAQPINFRLAEEGEYLCADGSIYTSRGNVLGGRLSIWEWVRRSRCALGN